MHESKTTILSSIFILFCSLLGGCATSNEGQWTEVPPLSDSEFTALHERASELLIPARKSSGCRLRIHSLQRSLGFTQRGPKSHPEYSVWLVDENGDCSGAVAELKRVGESHDLWYGVMHELRYPTDYQDSGPPTDFTLIHEIGPVVEP